jgi:hypothetical protein
MRNRNTVYDLVSIVLITILFVAIILMLSAATSIPDVHVSHSTNECVQVLNYSEDDSYSCENMPTKYNKVWVQ